MLVNDDNELIDGMNVWANSEVVGLGLAAMAEEDSGKRPQQQNNFFHLRNIW